MAWETFDNIKGPKGDKGATGTISSASASSVPAGSAAEVVISGTTDVHAHFKIPRGEPGMQGPPGVASSASAKSVPADSPAKVTLEQHGELVHMALEVPRGLPGTNAVPTAAAIGANLAAGDSAARPGFESGLAQISDDQTSAFAVGQQARIDASILEKADLENGVVPDEQLNAATAATPGSIPKRDAFGRLPGIVAPVADTDAANRSYVDALGVVSVTNFGAVADGTTDVTVAVQRAATALAAMGGGRLVFPPGTYRLDGMVRVPADTQVMGEGARILKTFSSAPGFTYIAFAALGGSGWTRNVQISGLRFEGNLPASGVMVLWGHRCRGVRVSNVYVDGAITSGHVVDLQGCTDVIIEGSTFEGASPVVGREYVEVIQLDSSTAVGSPNRAVTTETFDGTPSQRVTVRGNRFIKKGTSYPAPRAFGCHSSVELKYYTDIVFEDNYVETPAESTSYRSVMNFVSVKRLLLSRNTFSIDPGKSFPYVVSFGGTNSWIKQTDVNNPDATYPPSTNVMLGSFLSTAGNTWPAGYTNVYRDWIEPTFEPAFKAYSAATAPLLYESNGQVELTGVFGKTNTTDPSGGGTSQVNISTNTEVTVGQLPDPDYYPKRTRRFSCSGSGSETFLLTVSVGGLITVSRYSNEIRTNPYLAVSVTWQRA